MYADTDAYIKNRGASLSRTLWVVRTGCGSPSRSRQSGPGGRSTCHPRLLFGVIAFGFECCGAAAPAIKAQALNDYGAHLERIHGELSPYVLGDRLSAADPYLHMLAAWYPEDEAPLASRLPKLTQHAGLLRRRPATLKAERDHAEE